MIDPHGHLSDHAAGVMEEIAAAIDMGELLRRTPEKGLRFWAEHLPRPDEPQRTCGLEPTTMTLDEDAVIRALWQANGLLMLAAKALGVSRAELKQYLSTRPRASEAWWDAYVDYRHGMLDMVEAALQQAVLRGDKWALRIAAEKLGVAPHLSTVTH